MPQNQFLFSTMIRKNIFGVALKTNYLKGNGEIMLNTHDIQLLLKHLNHFLLLNFLGTYDKNQKLSF